MTDPLASAPITDPLARLAFLAVLAILETGEDIVQVAEVAENHGANIMGRATLNEDEIDTVLTYIRALLDEIRAELHARFDEPAGQTRVDLADSSPHATLDPQDRTQRGLALARQQLQLIRSLAAARVAAGLTVEALAETLGVAPDTVYRFEKGGTNPTLAMIRRYALAVHADLQLLAIAQIHR